MSIILFAVGGRAGSTSMLTALDGTYDLQQIMPILLYFPRPGMSPSGLLSPVITTMTLVLGSIFYVGRIANKIMPS